MDRVAIAVDVAIAALLFLLLLMADKVTWLTYDDKYCSTETNRMPHRHGNPTLRLGLLRQSSRRLGLFLHCSSFSDDTVLLT